MPATAFQVASAAGLLTALASAGTAIAGEPAADERKPIDAYCARWVGARAPELGPAAQNRTIGLPVKLSAYRGKRILLISFDAGNFVDLPDEKKLLTTLRAIDKARQTSGGELVVVGFTRGVAFIWPFAGLMGEPKGEAGQLSRDYPIVNVTSRTFNEPYNVLLMPAAIVVDRQGVLRAFYAGHDLSPQEIADAAKLPDWEGPVRSPPVEDPWEGKGPPKPLRQLVKVWTQPAEDAVLGMTATGEAGHGPVEAIAVTQKAMLFMDPDTGRVKRRVAMDGVSSDLPVTVRWAEIRPGQGAVMYYHGGWPHSIPVLSGDGALLWKYESDAGIESAAWVRLREGGGKQLLVGDRKGLHAVDSRGKRLWTDGDVSSAYSVGGFDARGDRPGLVLCADGRIVIDDVAGKRVRTLPSGGYFVTDVAAADMDEAGTRQVMAIWIAPLRTRHYAVATDLEGKVLWKYPLRAEPEDPPLLAADLDGDGTKEWLLATGPGELVALDSGGRLLARIEYREQRRWFFWIPAWTAVTGKGKIGCVIVAEAGRLTGYALR